MAATLLPLQGYPFALDVLIDYRLTDDGLSVTTTATNVGDHPCPYGCGQHPYLSPGAGLIDDCTLHLAADTRIVTDPNRELPVGTEPVGGTPHNFRAGKTLNDLKVDYAFTSLTRDAEDRAWVRLTGIDGRVAELWVDPGLPNHRDLHRRHPCSLPTSPGAGHRTNELPTQRVPVRCRRRAARAGSINQRVLGSPPRSVTRTAPPCSRNRPLAGPSKDSPRLRPVVRARIAPALPGHPLQTAYHHN